jgi:NADPH:quinone reductase-like Zn-dependent oxidoreductase
LKFKKKVKILVEINKENVSSERNIRNSNSIEVKNLKKYFIEKKRLNDVKAVDGISFNVREAELLGFRKPRQAILGTELAGEIEAVGKVVKLIRKADQIFGYTRISLGAYVEYICLPEDGVLAIKPKNMTFEEAAAVQQRSLTALYFLRKAKIHSGQKKGNVVIVVKHNELGE